MAASPINEHAQRTGGCAAERLLPYRLRASLADRIGAATTALVLLFSLAIGIASLAYSLHLTREASTLRLDEQTREAARLLARTLGESLNDSRLLAGNPTVVGAVLDAGLPDSYLAPLLASFRPAGREADLLCVTDYRGRPIACSGTAKPSVDAALIEAVVGNGREQARLIRRQQRDYLQIAVPVIHRESGPEGSVVAEYAIEHLVAATFGSMSAFHHLHLTAAGERDVFQHGPMGETTSDHVPIEAGATLRPLALELHLGFDGEAIAAPLRRVLLAYLGLLLFLLPLVFFAARAAGRLLSARLRALAAASSQLIEGSECWSPAAFGEDEVGQLADAFADLVRQLHHEQRTLEARVQERTQALAESAAQLALLNTAVEQGPTTVIMTDTAGRIQYVNHQFELTTGYSAAEVLGENPRLLKSPRLLPYEYASLWATITAGQVWRGEFENRRKDGSSYWAMASIAPLKDLAGNISGFVAVEEDITLRRQAERETREREAFLRTLIESLPDTLLVLDYAGRVRHYRPPDSPGLLAGGDWFVGRHYVEVVPPEIAAQLNALLPEMRYGAKRRGFEYTLGAGAARRHFSASIRAISAEDPGHDGFVVLARDVSEAIALQRQIVRAEARFRTLLEEIEHVAVQGYNAQRRVVFWNKASERLYGYSRDEAVGRRIEDLVIPDALRSEFLTAIDRWLTDGVEIAPGELTLRDKAGGEVHVYSCHALQYNAAGEPEMFCLDVDLSERRKAEAQMRQALVVFNASNQGIMTTDAQGVITSINPAFSDITGYAASEVIGHKSSIFKSGRHDQAFYETMWQSLSQAGSWEGEIWNRRKNGELYPQWLTISAVRDEMNRVVEYVGLFSDISLRKQQEELIWRQANFDSLTGLANRNLLKDRLERALAQARRNDRLVGLLYLDLDRFKEVNDRYGHAVGDELLVDVARRLTACVREQDTVARLGGDEFTLVIHDAASVDDLRRIAEKVVEALRKPFHLSRGAASVAASVGIAVFPDDGEDVDTLLRNADAAMYAAKAEGRERIVRFERAAHGGDGSGADAATADSAALGAK
jgi:diguanylate cyclase (GGDEF)-like protein/PAS domain S-box-containing protein